MLSSILKLKDNELYEEYLPQEKRSTEIFLEKRLGHVF